MERDAGACLFMRQRTFRLGLPWWLIVGLLGFLVFGGWRGFFGAIIGVLLIPLVIVLGLFLLGFLLFPFMRKRFIKFQVGSPPFGQSPPREEKPYAAGDVFEAEATVVGESSNKRIIPPEN